MSCSLDASTRIYACRVDNVHAGVMELVSGLAGTLDKQKKKKSKDKEDQNEGENSGNEDDDDEDGSGNKANNRGGSRKRKVAFSLIIFHYFSVLTYTDIYLIYCFL